MATTWTEGRKRSFITSVLRSGSRKWPPKYLTLNEAKTEKKINVKSGRQAQHYLCNACQLDFPAKEVQVDHIKPVIDPKTGFVSWDVFIERLFCDKSNLQVLCTQCHKAKTLKENKQSKSTQQSKQKKVKLPLKASSRKKKQTT